MENQSDMKFPKMNSLFLRWIEKSKKYNDDDHYTATSPEKCDREFLLIYIRFFQPKFMDDECITFDDLVLKAKSMIIHSEIEYPLTAPYYGKIFWKIRNASEPMDKFEFEWLHESGALESDQSYTGIDDLPENEWEYDSEIESEWGSESEPESDSDEDDDLIVESVKSDAEPIFVARDIYYNEVRKVLTSMDHLELENKKHERKFSKLLRDILQNKPFIKKWLTWRMDGDPDFDQIIQNLSGDPGGPILEFRERLSFALWNIDHQRRFHDNLHSPW